MAEKPKNAKAATALRMAGIALLIAALVAVAYVIADSTGMNVWITVAVALLIGAVIIAPETIWTVLRARRN